MSCCMRVFFGGSLRCTGWRASQRKGTCNPTQKWSLLLFFTLPLGIVTHPIACGGPAYHHGRSSFASVVVDADHRLTPSPGLSCEPRCS